MVFLEKKNITKWEHIRDAAFQTGLDTLKLKADFVTNAKEMFEADLALSKKLGVRGFPTLFFIDSLNNQQLVYGFKPYQAFEDATLKAFPIATKMKYDNSWGSLFNVYPTLTTKEFSELSGSTKAESEMLLQELTAAGKIHKINTKNGPLWAIK